MNRKWIQFRAIMIIMVMLLITCATGFTNEESAIMQQLKDVCVVWDSPSQDYNGSMPLGNGDISLNAWFEPQGELVSRTLASGPGGG